MAFFDFLTGAGKAAPSIAKRVEGFGQDLTDKPAMEQISRLQKLLMTPGSPDIESAITDFQIPAGTSDQVKAMLSQATDRAQRLLERRTARGLEKGRTDAALKLEGERFGQTAQAKVDAAELLQTGRETVARIKARGRGGVAVDKRDMTQWTIEQRLDKWYGVAADIIGQLGDRNLQEYNRLLDAQARRSAIQGGFPNDFDNPAAKRLIDRLRGGAVAPPQLATPTGVAEGFLGARIGPQAAPVASVGGSQGFAAPAGPAVQDPAVQAAVTELTAIIPADMSPERVTRELESIRDDTTASPAERQAATILLSQLSGGGR